MNDVLNLSFIDKMDIEDISKIIKPLEDRGETYYPYLPEFYYVGDCKALRIGSCSDILMNIQLEWSYDGEHKGVTTSCVIATIWRSVKIDIEMPYVRFRIVKNVQTPNKELTIAVMKWSKFEKKRVSLPPEAGILRQTLGKIESPPMTLPITLPVTIEPEREKTPSPARRRWSRQSPIGVTEIPLELEMKEASPKKHPKNPFSLFRRKTDPPAPKNLPIRDPRIPEYLPKGSILYCGVGNTIRLLPPGLPNEFLTMGLDGPEWKFIFPSPQMVSDMNKIEPESVDKIPTAWFDK